MLSIVEGYNAGEVALLCVLGFVIVIAVLIVLVLILMLFSKGFGAAEKAAAGIKQRRAEATSAAEKAADEPGKRRRDRCGYNGGNRGDIRIRKCRCRRRNGRTGTVRHQIHQKNITEEIRYNA